MDNDTTELLINRIASLEDNQKQLAATLITVRESAAEDSKELRKSLANLEGELHKVAEAIASTVTIQNRSLSFHERQLAALEMGLRNNADAVALIQASDNRQNTALQATEQAMVAFRTATRARDEVSEARDATKALDRRLNFIAAAILGSLLVIGGNSIEDSKSSFWVVVGGVAFDAYALLILTGHDKTAIEAVSNRFGGSK